MFKGFYNLSSAMLTQTRNLDVIGNNMSNTATNGYKADRYVDTTFEEVMRSRIGNKDKQSQELGVTTSYITALGEVYTDHSDGAPQMTGIPLDFAIEGDGYFSVQSVANGQVYTRNGSFMLDDQGYLYMPGQGRVLGSNGQPIYLGTDKIECTGNGAIYNEDGQLLGQIGVFAFQNPAQDLTKTGEGMFQANGQAALSTNFTLHQNAVERSNIDLVLQMTEMMTCQRALQSASQVNKMYDQLMNKASTELGRV